MTKKNKSPAPIDTDQTVSEAVQIILKHNYNYLLAWEQSARSWDDIEGVHQTRVAFRRMRSALSAFRAAIPRKVSKPWSNELRDLASQLGNVYFEHTRGVQKLLQTHCILDNHGIYLHKTNTKRMTDHHCILCINILEIHKPSSCYVFIFI
ncbi:MAG: CHAD domain-containing protein, partial [Candidatus Thiodiazotropha endolucinida]